MESWVCLSQTSLRTEKYLMFVSNTRPPPEKPADIAVGSPFMKLSLNSLLTFNYFIMFLVSVRLIQGPSQQRQTLSHARLRWCRPNRFSPHVNTSNSTATAWTWKCWWINDEPGLIHVWCRQVSALNQSQHSQHLCNTDAWRTQPRTAPPRDAGRKDNKNSDSAEPWFLLHNTCLIFTH